MSFLAGQSELVFRADEMQVFSGQRDLTGAGFSFFWAGGGAQRRRRVFIRTPCGGRIVDVRLAVEAEGHHI